MPLGKGYERQDCAIARALEVLGERWTLLVLRDCFFGVRRFGDLVAHLDVPRAVLADRLATLVEAGVLAREGTDYVVTEEAHALWPALFALGAWGDRHRVPAGGSVRRFAHAACAGGDGVPGPDLRPDGRCPRCGTAPGPTELVVHVVAGPDDADALRDDPVSVALRRPHRLLTPLR